MKIEDIKNIADNILSILDSYSRSNGAAFVKREFNEMYDCILKDFNENKLSSTTQKEWDEVLDSKDNKWKIKRNESQWYFSRSFLGTYRFCGEMRGYAIESLDYFALNHDNVIEWRYLEMDESAAAQPSHRVRITSSGKCVFEYC